MGDRTLMLAACLTALFATTVLAALAGYTGSVGREGLRRTLAGADFESVGTRIAAPVPPGGFADAERRVASAVHGIYGDLPVDVTTSARSDSYTMPGQERKARPELTAFATFSGIERHARMVTGRWPSAGGTPEAALPLPAAKAMRVNAGDTLTLRGRVDLTSAVRVKVTGLFAVDRVDDYFWQGDRLITTGVERLDYTTFGPFVVPPETFAARFTAGGAYLRWTVAPDLGRLRPGGLAAVGRRAATMKSRIDASAPKAQSSAQYATQYTVVTGLPAVAGQLDGALQVTRSTMLIPVLQLIVLAGYALMLVARLLADHRRTEVALLRARGAALRQLAGLTVAEGLILVLPAAVLAPLLAGPLLRLAARAPAVSATGLRLDAGPAVTLWAASIGAALACALLLTMPTLRGAALTYVETQAGRSRSARRGLAQRSGADLALLLVATLGIWQLTRYGGQVRAAPEEGATGGVEIDPFIVSGPALALLAGGLLVLRSVPVVSRLAERVFVRGRGFAPAFGAWQVGRRPVRYAGPVLLLVMAIAVGVLSASTISTWRNSQVAQADFEAAADLRVTAAQRQPAPSPLGEGARLAELPGVASVRPVLRQQTSTGSQDVTMLAGDTRAVGPMLLGGEGGALSGARPRPVLATVPGTPGSITFELRLTPDRSWPDAPSSPGFVVGVTLSDGRGLLHRVKLAGLRPDGRVRTSKVRTADLAGAGGRLTFPLSVRGFHYVYGENPYNGRMRLDVRKVSGEGTAAAPAPGAGAWDVFGDSQARGKDRPSPATRPGELLGIMILAYPVPREDSAFRHVVESMHAVLVEPSARAPHRFVSGGRALIPALPGFISADLAARAHVRIGGTVTLGTGGGDQPITVIGIVAALPSTRPDRPAVLVDLPTLTERMLSVGAMGDQPGEWWLTVRGGHSAPVVRELARHPDLSSQVVDRFALRRQLRDAPLGGALQGALILGFLAAIAFALVGFVVNAAVSARERAAEFAVLRALGVRARQILGVLALEQAFLVVLGLAGGTLLGLVIARLVIPHVVLTVRAAAPYPPVDLIIDWPAVAGMLGGVGVLLTVTLLLLGRSLRRQGLGAGLRMGERA